MILLLFLLFYGPFSFAQTGCISGDCINGEGVFIFENKDRYQGSFQDKRPHGRGKYAYANGSLYVGNFDQGKKEGYGDFSWTNGDRYLGEYQQDLRHGEGTYIFSNGSRQQGLWKAGAFIGPIPESHTSDSSAVSDSFRILPATAYKELNRLALVIGNADYSDNPLKNPVNDAKLMAASLQDCGFQVMLYLNVDQKTLKKAIRSYGEALQKSKSTGLFYFAGHGLQADGRNYLIPTKARIEKITDIEFEAVDLGRVMSELEYANNGLNILILDACRDNPYRSRFEGSKYASYNGLANIGAAPYNSFIAFSTSPGAVAMDGKGLNSLYTATLCQSMQQSNKSLESVFREVRKVVRERSDGMQVPWESSSVEDEFYFKPY